MNTRKFWRIILTSFANTITYRANLATSFIVISLPFVISVIFWKRVFIEQELLGGYTLSQIITYYFFVLFTQDFTYPVLNYDIATDIKNGYLSYYLLRPLSYPLYAFFSRLGANLAYFAIVFIFAPLFFLLFHRFIIVPLPGLPIFFFTILLAYILATLISFSISFFTFFLEDFRGLESLMSFLVPIFSGTLLPLKLLPSVLYKISLLFPFRFLINYPINVFMGTEKFTTNNFLLILVWSLIFLLLDVIMWGKGLKRYQAIGG